ncbi:MAG: gamma-glutamylcyclotransferase [Deltaproteobacteria bacterium]|nr:MAG: gamma-glutamylcyclotransferase [Deltaproteobacteria bacterium]
MTGDASNAVVLHSSSQKKLHPLFVYGTLIFPEVVAALLGALSEARPATAKGFSVRALKGRIYPGLAEEAGALAEGILYYGLDGEKMDTLDRFEGEEYRLSEIRVACGEEELTALVYLLAEPFTELLTVDRWDRLRFFQNHLDSYVKLCRSAGPMSAAELTCGGK